MTYFSLNNRSTPIMADDQALLGQIMSAAAPAAAAEAGIRAFDPQSDLRFRFINNPDGSIRWIVPDQARQPHFLSLYGSQNLKARMYRQGVQWGYQLGQKQRFFQGGFSLDEQRSWALPTWLQEEAGHEYAIFTGTAGNTRKTVVALAPHGKVSHFVKIAHTQRAQDLLSNERSMLQHLAQQPWKHLRFPEVSAGPQANMLKLSNVKPAHHEPRAELQSVHVQALQELWQGAKHCGPQEVTWLQPLLEKLHSLPSAQAFPNKLDKQILQQLIEGLKGLAEELLAEKELQVSLTHGDFTPWNMFATEAELYLFDWEYAQQDYPLYFDFFHYFYQSEILLHRRAEDLLSNMQPLATRVLPASWPLYHKWYLLITISQYLSDYASWEQVFVQAHWLIAAWNRILKAL
jgi:thiamine kinase-like enzyme